MPENSSDMSQERCSSQRMSNKNVSESFFKDEDTELRSLKQTKKSLTNNSRLDKVNSIGVTLAHRDHSYIILLAGL